jgi:hypothetical protein
VKELLASGGARPSPAAPAAPSVAPASAEPAAPAESAEELFTRLDEAFARLGMSPSAAPAPAALGEPPRAAVPGDEPPTVPATPGEQAPPVVHTAPELLVAAFRALLAHERGEPLPLRAPAAASRSLGDADVEHIVARVLERLNDRALREAAKELVAPIAERLVRDEIERIKSSQ